MKNILKLALGCALLVSSVYAYADVIANGSMVAARRTADAISQVSCFSNNFGYASCSMTYPSGESIACVTSDPKYVDVIRSINPESSIMLYLSGDGTCYYVGVQNSSSYISASVAGY